MIGRQHGFGRYYMIFAAVTLLLSGVVYLLNYKEIALIMLFLVIISKIVLHYVQLIWAGFSPDMRKYRVALDKLGEALEGFDMKFEPPKDEDKDQDNKGYV